MSKWKNPLVIRVERGFNENRIIYTLLERVNVRHGINQYIHVDEFNSMDKALKKRHEILQRYAEKPRRKKAA